MQKVRHTKAFIIIAVLVGVVASVLIYNGTASRWFNYLFYYQQAQIIKKSIPILGSNNISEIRNISKEHAYFLKSDVYLKELHSHLKGIDVDNIKIERIGSTKEEGFTKLFVYYFSKKTTTFLPSN